jgi:hypothetical protein
MVKLLLVIVIIGTLAYLLIKFSLYVYRPFFLSKTFMAIEEMYNRLQIAADKDIDLDVEYLKKWQSGDGIVKAYSSEDEIMERIKTTRAAKTHEEEVYGKFLRLRERYALNPKQLSESIVAYRRYLQVRFQHYENAMLCESAVTSGAFSFDEMMAARKEAMIILEENERKLDILLTE